MRTAHQLGQGRVFNVGQASAQLGLRQEQVPKPGGLGLGFQFFDNSRGLPAVTLGNLLLKHMLIGEHMFLHERINALAQFFNFGGISEIHDDRLF